MRRRRFCAFPHRLFLEFLRVFEAIVANEGQERLARLMQWFVPSVKAGRVC
jgi:hypothetical protein